MFFFLYQNSIASSRSTTFALALANRAVVFFKIKEFKLAVEDIDEAIKSNKYPDENVHKLYRRLTESYQHMHEFEKAIYYYEKLQASLKLSKLSNTQKTQIVNQTGNFLSLCKNEAHLENRKSKAHNEKQEQEEHFPSYKAVHPEIKYASGKKNLFH